MDNSKQNIIIYNTPDGKSAVSLYTKDDNVWMKQNQIAELFDTSIPNISMHISNILKENELVKISVIKDYLTTASDGKNYSVTFYNLDMILAIGFRVRSKRGTQFRIWANQNLKEYMIKGFLMDTERLKNPDGKLDYFDELLARIRDVRASEKRFYQKVSDLFSLSSDYDATDKATQMFFAETQNKLLFAVTTKTASELIVARANENEPNMALKSWTGTIVRKQDIYIAKNYLNEDEIDTLNRLVVIFLETAELRVKEKKDITMDFWKQNVDKILIFNDKSVLKHSESIVSKQMEDKVMQVYENFNLNRSKFELQLEEEFELNEIEKMIEKRLK